MPLFRQEITTLSTDNGTSIGEYRGVLDSQFSRGFPTAVQVFRESFGGGPTASAEPMNDRIALSISTVYTAVTYLAEAIGSLPCQLMRKTSKGREVADDHNLYRLLAKSPNPEMTAFTFWSTMVGCSALTGNGYAQIMRDYTGAVDSIWPLHPLLTEPVRFNGQLAFKTSDGEAEGNYRIVPAKDILHFPLFSLRGDRGIGPVQAAREPFALAKAQEKFGARYFANGAQVPYFLINKDGADPEQIATFARNWEAAHTRENQHRQGFLWGNWEVKSVGLSPEDSQFLASRAYQRADIAAMFKLPPHVVGDTTRMSNNNYEQQQLAIVTDCIRPIVTRIEQELELKLMPSTGPNAGKLYVRFDMSDRQRGDNESLILSLVAAINGGLMTPNEARARVSLDSDGPEGDVLRYPVNTGNAEQLLHATTLLQNKPAPQLPAPQDDKDEK